MAAPDLRALTQDPLPGPPALLQGLGDLASSRQGCLELPVVEGLHSGVIARWLYRAWLERAPAWRPLVHLDPARSGREPRRLEMALDLAQGGFLSLGEGWATLGGRSALIGAARRADTLLLLAGAGPALRLSRVELDRLAREDTWHAVATDPALDGLRRAVFAHARAGGLLHLRGELHTGRVTLVALAHGASGDEAPLEVMAPGELREPRPGRWVVYERIEGASQAQLLWAEAREPRRAPGSGAMPWVEPARKLDPSLQALVDRSPGLAGVVQEAQTYKGWLSKNLLISGETGAGKGVLARAIHEASRPYRPFVHIDLNAISQSLVEGELFGHVRGSFTDARGPREGLIRAANEGTVFLDEIGRLPLPLQQKLLVVLDTRRVRPVGGDAEIEVDVRWLAATNRDLDGLVRAGEFLPDLLQRLRGWELRIPPLRERPEDIPFLAEHHLAAFVGALRARAERVPVRDRSPEDQRILSLRQPPALSGPAQRALQAWPWPGNVRELSVVLESAAIRADFERIELDHLGELASAGRPCPVFLTSSLTDEQIAARAPSEALLLRRLTTLTLDVPPLRHRGDASVRHHLLAALDGHPVERAALEALASRPWYGNLRELDREMRALRAAVAGPITVESLRVALPHLVTPSTAAPILVLMHPTVQADGSVSGLIQSFDRGALVIGRGTVDDLLHGCDGDARLVERATALRRIIGDGEPGVLSLGSHPDLSRQHLVINRVGDGIELVGLPGTALLAAGGALHTERRYKARPGERVPLGPAGEVLVMGADGSVYLQIFVFAGRAAYVERVGALRDRALLSASPTRGQVERPRVCWILDPAEADALNRAVLELARSSEGRFKGGLKLAADQWRAAGLERLARYIDSSHPVQSCTRLYEHNRGHLLVQQLQQRVDNAAESALWSGLPKGIRELLVRPGPSISLMGR